MKNGRKYKPKSRSGRSRRSKRNRASADKTKVVLDIDVAQEVVALIDDQPGDADESLLDSASDALQNSAARVPSEAQHRVAAGEAVAMELDDSERDAVQVLSEDDTETRPELLKRARSRIGSKLRLASRRRDRR